MLMWTILLSTALPQRSVEPVAAGRGAQRPLPQAVGAEPDHDAAAGPDELQVGRRIDDIAHRGRIGHVGGEVQALSVVHHRRLDVVVGRIGLEAGRVELPAEVPVGEVAVDDDFPRRRHDANLAEPRLIVGRLGTPAVQRHGEPPQKAARLEGDLPRLCGRRGDFAGLPLGQPLLEGRAAGAALHLDDHRAFEDLHLGRPFGRDAHAELGALVDQPRFAGFDREADGAAGHVGDRPAADQEEPAPAPAASTSRAIPRGRRPRCGRRSRQYPGSSRADLAAGPRRPPRPCCSVPTVPRPWSRRPGVRLRRRSMAAPGAGGLLPPVERLPVGRWNG